MSEVTHHRLVLDSTPKALDAPGEFSINYQTYWSIGQAVNGGFIMTTLLRAAQAASTSSHPDVISSSAHYLRKTDEGQGFITTQVLKTSKTLKHIQVTLKQNNEIKVVATVILGKVGQVTTGPTHNDRPKPEPRDPNTAIVDTPTVLPFRAGLVMQDFRQYPIKNLPYQAGYQWWIQLNPDTPTDLTSTAFYLDAFQPTIIYLPNTEYIRLGQTTWCATLDFTVHFLRKPAPGSLLFRHYANFSVNGFVQADAEIWDSELNLVAISRQSFITVPWSRNTTNDKSKL